MGCFPCGGGGGNSTKRLEKEKMISKKNHDRREDRPRSTTDTTRSSPHNGVKTPKVETQSPAPKEVLVNKEEVLIDGVKMVINATTFSFDEMVTATENFKLCNFLGEGGFGKVYKGRLSNTDQIVAIKQLDHNGLQGKKEFLVEVVTLSMANHPNLVKLIGYCSQGRQRLLVYEYMPLGSLEDHLHGRLARRQKLDWNIRMKIAAGAARGLEYLHDKMKPAVIYRDLKCSNILLEEGYHPKLSDFGLAKVGPVGDKTHVSTRVMGTYGYCAPDYAMTGQLTFKSDIYSFGVVLLEIITGRKAIDETKSADEQNLVAWARPLFKDRRKFPQMADPALEGQYPLRGLYQALAIAAMCVQEQPNLRPLIADIVTALNYLAAQTYDPQAPSSQASRRVMSSSGSRRDFDEDECVSAFSNSKEE